VHVSTCSEVASHCSVFALSDSTNPDLRQQCDHQHYELCEQCESLSSAIESISTAVEQVTFTTNDDRDEAVYLAKSATLAVSSWKCHLLRSAHQDQARLDVIAALNNETVFIVNDWAMKFLPQRYRESQTDWFGKRGISWHISVAYRRVDGELKWEGFVHVIRSCSQSSAAVITIMRHVLDTLKKEHPDITKAYFRQDNAGCYHSSSTIMACRDLATHTGIHVVRIDFSDPQGGKGAADRLAATCKSHIRTYINEGHDVCTAADMKDALLSNGGLKGVRVAAIDTILETPDTSCTIKGITKLNNFEFSATDAITCWRAYGVGQGTTIQTDKLPYGEYN